MCSTMLSRRHDARGAFGMTHKTSNLGDIFNVKCLETQTHLLRERRNQIVS